MLITLPCASPRLVDTDQWPALSRITHELRGRDAGSAQGNEVQHALQALGLDRPGSRLDIAGLAAILCSPQEPAKINAVFALASARVLNLAPEAPRLPWPCSVLARKRRLPLSPSRPSFAHVLACEGQDAPAAGLMADLANRFVSLRATGLDLDMRSNPGRTPLHLALMSRNPGAANALIALGADINARDNLGFTALMLAVRASFDAGVRALIAAGADIHAVATTLQSTALHLAGTFGNAGVVEALVAAGAPLEARNAWQLEPLHMAAGAGNAIATHALIDAGAQPNRLADRNNESSPLLYAALCGNANTILALAHRGANLELPHCAAQTTALHIASRANRRYAVEALVAAGANINSRDAQGCTPLHHAASERAHEAAASLIRLGANVTATGHSGYRPLELAGYAGDSRMCQMLRRAGDQGHYTFIDRAPGGGGA